MKIDGVHVMVDAYDCDGNLFDNMGIFRALESACLKAGCTICTKAIYNFVPQGCSVVFILSESHASIHTFPEERCFSFDCYTCGPNAKPEIAADYLVQFFGAKRQVRSTIKRG